MAVNGIAGWLRVLLRFLQFLFSLIALICVSAGFVVTEYYGYTSMLGSSPVTYTQLMTYTGMLLALWLLIAEWTLIALPVWWLTALLDLTMSILLLIAAIALVVSDYVNHCSVYGYMLRCGNLEAAVVFTFLAMAAFFLTPLMSACYPTGTSSGDQEQTGRGSGAYHSEGTPRATSPHEP